MDRFSNTVDADLLMEFAFEPDLLVRKHWTHGDFGLCRFKSRQKKPARQLVLNFSAGYEVSPEFARRHVPNPG
jgi:hypothetical protein